MLVTLAPTSATHHTSEHSSRLRISWIHQHLIIYLYSSHLLFGRFGGCNATHSILLFPVRENVAIFLPAGFKKLSINEHRVDTHFDADLCYAVLESFNSHSSSSCSPRLSGRCVSREYYKAQVVLWCGDWVSFLYVKTHHTSMSVGISVGRWEVYHWGPLLDPYVVDCSTLIWDGTHPSSSASSSAHSISWLDCCWWKGRR